MQKLTDTSIALLHIGTLSETVALLNEGHFCTALWHALATSGIVLIIVAISALTYLIAHKVAKMTQKKPRRKTGKRTPVRQVQNRQRVSKSQGK